VAGPRQRRAYRAEWHAGEPADLAVAAGFEMMESDEPRFHFLKPDEHPFHLFPVSQLILAAVAIDGEGPVSVVERLPTAVFPSQAAEATNGHPTGHDGQIGRQARPAREAAEHGGVLMEHFQEDVGEQIFAVGRRQRHLTLGSGAVNNKGEQPDEPGDEGVPGRRLPMQAILEELPILWGKDRCPLAGFRFQFSSKR